MKNFLPSKILQIFFRLAIFGEKLSLLIFWCEGLGSFLKGTFSGHGKSERIVQVPYFFKTRGPSLLFGIISISEFTK